MKVWTVILAGVLLAALPNPGNSALEDAGVVVSNTYTEFERRVLPANTPLICSASREYQWFQINELEQILLDFENGKNTMNATFHLGTPTLLVAMNGKDDFVSPNYCKYLPKAFHNATGLRNEKTQFSIRSSTFEYYAVKIKDMERATITTGWNHLCNVVKNRFPSLGPSNYVMLIVEKTAAGVIYVGTIPNQ